MVFGEGDFQFGEFVVPEKTKSKKDIVREVLRKFENPPKVSYGKIPNVSYSQYSMYRKCPKKWYETYVTKNVKTEQNIHFVFGTSMHEVLQEWISKVYESSIKEAESMDLDSLLKNKIIHHYQEAYKKEGKHFSSPQELALFHSHGVEIIKFFKKNRVDYINTRDMILVGIELPIFLQVLENSPLKVVGYLDLVFYDVKENKYIIYDLKTGKRGWSKEDKKDKVKINQLILYKNYFSKQYEVPISDIEVRYILTKREVYTEGEFPEKRINLFIPPQAKITVEKAVKDFENFIKQCFNLETGKHIINEEVKPIGGVNFSNCNFCPLKDNEELCSKNKRVLI